MEEISLINQQKNDQITHDNIQETATGQKMIIKMAVTRLFISKNIIS